MALSSQVRIRLNEAVERLCVDLEIPYSARESRPSTEDKRPYSIAAALEWLTEFAVRDAQITIANQNKDLQELRQHLGQINQENNRLKREVAAGKGKGK